MDVFLYLQLQEIHESFHKPPGVQLYVSMFSAYAHRHFIVSIGVMSL